MREIQDQFSELEQVKWVRGHIENYMSDIYCMSEECKEILNALQIYADNLYTYPVEAVRTFQRFKEHFNNNPYEYISGLRKKDNKKQIFAARLDAYFLPWEKGKIVPASMLAEVLSPEDMQKRYKAFLEEGLRAYKKEQLEAMAKEVEKTENGIIHLVAGWSGSIKDGKPYNLLSFGCISIMWLMYFFAIIPKSAGALVMLIGMGAVCALASVLWGIGVSNSRLLKAAQTKKMVMKNFTIVFEHFYKQQCNIYNMESMILTDNKILPESRIPWDDYYDIREFLDTVGAKATRKLLLMDDRFMYAAMAFIIIQFFCWVWLLSRFV